MKKRNEDVGKIVTLEPFKVVEPKLEDPLAFLSNSGLKDFGRIIFVRSDTGWTIKAIKPDGIILHFNSLGDFLKILSK